MTPTPILDFVRKYEAQRMLRLHMPGHKGCGPLGVEQWDITEISGADSLYEADGIIRQSEEIAGKLFGCPTFYSTEGSSQCIRAMLYLCLLRAKESGNPPVIAAGRNVHRTFLTAAALLDFDIQWIYPKNSNSYLSCKISAEEVDDFLRNSPVLPTAVYLTSPDYLGNMVDVKAIAEVCHRYGVLLAVDNAHGAYLRFLPASLHPMDLGADLCCDSAHKTLSVLTGGAYLHCSDAFADSAKQALALFGSTSPSYLILQSLDAVNPYLAREYPGMLAESVEQIRQLKERLCGYEFVGDEPMKLTIRAKSYGYTGQELANILRRKGIEPEFSDPDYLVLMLTPEIEIEPLEEILRWISRRESIDTAPPLLHPVDPVLSVRDAMLSPSKAVPISEALGGILADASVGCPPAVPIVVSGERIDDVAVECFRYYGIDSIRVVK